jgi:hypothetical protein
MVFGAGGVAHPTKVNAAMLARSCRLRVSILVSEI